MDNKDLSNIIRFMDYKIGKYLEPSYTDDEVIVMYTKGKQKACFDVKNLFLKILYDKFQHVPLAKEDVLDLILIMDSKKNNCDVKSLNTPNGLHDVSVKGQSDLYSEVKGILEDFLCEYDEESLCQH
ncbi:hypothetical protein ACOBQJ_05070 [Pelotomaculum propionicicum]|uniref:hypothetical protein n=1 Tax=Pelotomaculum propionicicum TaxID=258475 RepID=UPI003B7A5E76